MRKVILYYKFAPLNDPEAIRLWQRSLCQKLRLKGRILISPHGINGTLGGELADLKNYLKDTKSYGVFKDISFKWSEGGRDDFPKLSVKVRDEIVSFGVPGDIEVDAQGIVGGGRRLKPRQVHELVEQRGSDDVVFFDGRNVHEAAIGKFKNAVLPAVEHSRDFVQELDDPKYDAIKNKAVVTYCTGGIRCEVLSVLMKKRGFTEVYQLDGGIASYGAEYGDDGLWEGALYVFDGRMVQKFTPQAKDIGSCVHCRSLTSNYENCTLQTCNDLILICQTCAIDRQFCASHQPKHAKTAA